MSELPKRHEGVRLVGVLDIPSPGQEEHLRRYKAPRAVHPSPDDVDNPALDFEPEHVPRPEKNQIFPPIITIDGRVDTDIDHLMDDDDDSALILQREYPRPHVFSVIHGSIDDDVDSLANHDGTMEHTLVDAPKQFNHKNLQDVASRGGRRKSPGRAALDQSPFRSAMRSPPNSPSCRSLEPYNRSHNKQRQDLSDADDEEGDQEDRRRPVDRRAASLSDPQTNQHNRITSNVTTKQKSKYSRRSKYSSSVSSQHGSKGVQYSDRPTSKPRTKNFENVFEENESNPTAENFDISLSKELQSRACDYTSNTKTRSISSNYTSTQIDEMACPVDYVHRQIRKEYKGENTSDHVMSTISSSREISNIPASASRSNSVKSQKLSNDPSRVSTIRSESAKPPPPPLSSTMDNKLANTANETSQEWLDRVKHIITDDQSGFRPPRHLLLNKKESSTITKADSFCGLSAKNCAMEVNVNGDNIIEVRKETIQTVSTQSFTDNGREEEYSEIGASVHLTNSPARGRYSQSPVRYINPLADTEVNSLLSTCCNEISINDQSTKTLERYLDEVSRNPKTSTICGSLKAAIRVAEQSMSAAAKVAQALSLVIEATRATKPPISDGFPSVGFPSAGCMMPLSMPRRTASETSQASSQSCETSRCIKRRTPSENHRTSQRLYLLKEEQLRSYIETCSKAKTELERCRAWRENGTECRNVEKIERRVRTPSQSCCITKGQPQNCHGGNVSKTSVSQAASSIKTVRSNSQTRPMALSNTLQTRQIAQKSRPMTPKTCHQITPHAQHRQITQQTAKYVGNRFNKSPTPKYNVKPRTKSPEQNSEPSQVQPVHNKVPVSVKPRTYYSRNFSPKRWRDNKTPIQSPVKGMTNTKTSSALSQDKEIRNEGNTTTVEENILTKSDKPTCEISSASSHNAEETITICPSSKKDAHNSKSSEATLKHEHEKTDTTTETTTKTIKDTIPHQEVKPPVSVVESTHKSTIKSTPPQHQEDVVPLTRESVHSRRTLSAHSRESSVDKSRESSVDKSPNTDIKISAFRAARSSGLNFAIHNDVQRTVCPTNEINPISLTCASPKSNMSSPIISKYFSHLVTNFQVVSEDVTSAKESDDISEETKCDSMTADDTLMDEGSCVDPAFPSSPPKCRFSRSPPKCRISHLLKKYNCSPVEVLAEWNNNKDIAADQQTCPGVTDEVNITSNNQSTSAHCDKHCKIPSPRKPKIQASKTSAKKKVNNKNSHSRKYSDTGPDSVYPSPRRVEGTKSRPCLLTSKKSASGYHPCRQISGLEAWSSQSSGDNTIADWRLDLDLARGCDNTDPQGVEGTKSRPCPLTSKKSTSGYHPCRQISGLEALSSQSSGDNTIADWRLDLDLARGCRQHRSIAHCYESPQSTSTSLSEVKTEPQPQRRRLADHQTDRYKVTINR